MSEYTREQKLNLLDRFHIWIARLLRPEYYV